MNSLYLMRFSAVHISSSAIRAAAIRITTNSSNSRSFETDTQPDGCELEQAEFEA